MALATYGTLMIMEAQKIRRNPIPFNFEPKACSVVLFSTFGLLFNAFLKIQPFVLYADVVLQVFKSRGAIT